MVERTIRQFSELGLPPEDRLERLLDYWEAAREHGIDLPAESLCPEDPELAKQLKLRLDALRRIDLFINSNSEELSPPEKIGPYRVIREIAHGGAAVVYLCEQRHPRRQVALKLLRAPQSSEKLWRRFQLEIQLLATLNHPGIAQIYDAGVVDVGYGPQPYFTMEAVPGRRLDEYLAMRDAELWSAEDTLKLFLRVCDALQYAHDQGVVHRDLKPSNILVTEAGEPKVIDFGVARLHRPIGVDQPTGPLTVALVGTPPYMSP